MKIVDNRKNNKAEYFSNLRAGDVFIDEDEDINIKVENDDTREYYAVILENGLVWFPSDNYCVIKLNARTVIED